MIDAQPGDGWQVATAVATALLDDPVAADAACAATEPLCGEHPMPDQEVWLRAARLGPADPEIGKAARAALAAAEAALGRSGAPRPLRDAVGRFMEHYTERGRCPANDQLDALRGGAAGRPAEGPVSSTKQGSTTQRSNIQGSKTLSPKTQGGYP
jgi:glutamate--cysteine ligase